ncbi:hypothetical protein [Brucella sp. NBRC 113783]|uniref:hypothetical protein n=1 Tax=Brucella sp. NBRC 113783 TaxID=3075478 RepID=UPI0029BFB9E2|nr:hypothetical protein [Brucella sp. NBRC 113783]MDX4074008.1 hypothetical protein [Brucella sp. NBRC 113783]
MVKLPLKALLCTSCVVLGTAGHGSAGGLERGGYNIDLLFNPDRFATEANSTYVMPNRKLNNVRDSSPWDGPVGGGRTDGVKESEAYQYVVMLNSDEFEKLQFGQDFNVEDHVLPTILRDTEDGGLFGFRFK